MEHAITMVTDDDNDEDDKQPIIYQSKNLSKGFYLFGPHFNLYQSLNRLPI